MEIITTTDDNRFTKFADTFYKLCNEDINDITVFRVPNYTRVRLCALWDNPAVVDEAQQIIVRRSLTTIVGYLDTELDVFVHHRAAFESTNSNTMCWTGSFIELIYGLQEMRCIDNGEIAINELLAAGFGKLFGIEIKDNLCYNTYADMKRRKKHFFLL